MRIGPEQFWRNVRTRCWLVLLLTLAGQRQAVADGPHFAADRPLDMQHIKLELAVDVARRHVDGVATLNMTPLRPVNSIKLDAADFDTSGVTIAMDGQAATTPRYSNDGKSIEIFLEHVAVPGQDLAITIQYALQDPKAGLHFFAPTDDDPDIPYQVWSQGETNDNHYWLPCFDQPNERQTSEIIATVDAQYQVLSNGRLAERHPADRGDRMVYHWLQNKPHPAYLITLVVGQFYVQEDHWRDVPISYWVPAERQADIATTFGNTPRMLEFFSERIGVKYPWDQYVQVCCHDFSGGMENTSATTLWTDALIDETARLDGDNDPLIAHELAHQWWGDLLTCREWPQVWLNEGFATYFEALWTEHDLGSDEFAYSMYEKEREALADDKDGPVVERYYDTTWQLFGSRSYSKGAWILHMLRCQLGDEAFFAALHRYCTTFADGVVETADLRRTLEEETGRSLGRFFYDWTERAGHPVVDVAYAWHEEEKSAEVVVRQKQDAAAATDAQGRSGGPFRFPLTLEFAFDTERAPVVVEKSITEREVTLVVPLPDHPAMLRVDPNQAVYMEITEHKGRDLWITQLTRDSNPVGRLRALHALVAMEKASPTASPPLQQIVPALLIPSADNFLCNLLAAAMRSERFWAVQCELARTLGGLGGPVAREALLEALASEQARVRTAVVEALCHFRGDEAVEAALRDLLARGDPSENVQRAVRNALEKSGD